MRSRANHEEWTRMAPRGKKTTMAKLNREAKLRERRLDKQARKDARKQTAVDRPADATDISMGTRG
jgi:hypothetical protein